MSDYAIGANGYKIQCLKTGEVSKKIWKTYKGAAKNITSNTQWVTTPEGIEWGIKHPIAFRDIADSRLPKEDIILKTTIQ